MVLLGQYELGPTSHFLGRGTDRYNNIAAPTPRYHQEPDVQLAGSRKIRTATWLHRAYRISCVFER